MANADITKYSSIKLDYLFCIIVIINGKAMQPSGALIINKHEVQLRVYRFARSLSCVFSLLLI